MHSHSGNNMFLIEIVLELTWLDVLEGATLGERAYSSGKGSLIHPSELPIELKEILIGSFTWCPPLST